MVRRIFLSFNHKDRMKAKGFNLLRWNKNVEFEFIGRHFLDPIDSNNDPYIRKKIREQIKGTSATIVLIGKKTFKSKWVKWEIEQSIQKEHPNGILAIRLEKDVPLPKNSIVGKILNDVGAEIIQTSLFFKMIAQITV